LATSSVPWISVSWYVSSAGVKHDGGQRTISRRESTGLTLRGHAAVAALALLAGSAFEQPRGVVRVTYECDQGRSFTARYERDGEVILELDGEERILPEVSAIAGTRYDDGTHELRLHGRNATLRGLAVTYSNCAARDWQEAERR
jgi:membrane-bound inhibitor of C-type lysozyme